MNDRTILRVAAIAALVAVILSSKLPDNAMFAAVTGIATIAGGATLRKPKTE